MRNFFSYERRIVGVALLAVVPLAAAAILLVWAGDYPAVVTWTVALLVGATLGVATLTYLPFAFFNLINPVVSAVYGFTGFTIEKIAPGEEAD